MRYISTRDPQASSASFCDILLAGLAPDGGLYLPETYPQLSAEQLNRWQDVLTQHGYAALAAEVLALFIDDIPREDLDGICARAYRTPVFSPTCLMAPRLHLKTWQCSFLVSYSNTSWGDAGIG